MNSEMGILSQASSGEEEGATTNAYGLEQSMRQHERSTALGLGRRYSLNLQEQKLQDLQDKELVG
jgi:hypothetical protein